VLLVGEPVHKRPKPNALHYATDANLSPQHSFFGFGFFPVSQPFTPHRNSAYRRQPQQ
jgi:hypothetical protein